jgi:hypothetical protein
MNTPLDSQDYVAGALAATVGDLEVKRVAGGNIESTVYQWFRVYDPSSDECRAILATDYGENPFCEPCDPDDKTELTKAFIKTLRFGGSEDDPSSWTCILEDGWVDQEWIDLQVLRPILEKGAAELGTNFDFDVWVVEGVRGKKPKGKKRKQAEP